MQTSALGMLSWPGKYVTIQEGKWLKIFFPYHSFAIQSKKLLNFVLDITDTSSSI